MNVEYIINKDTDRLYLIYTLALTIIMHKSRFLCIPFYPANGVHAFTDNGHCFFICQYKDCSSHAP